MVSGILLSILVVGQVHFSKHHELPLTQTTVLDLRNRSVARGLEQSPEAPLESAVMHHGEIFNFCYEARMGPTKYG